VPASEANVRATTGTADNHQRYQDSSDEAILQDKENQSRFGAEIRTTPVPSMTGCLPLSPAIIPDSQPTDATTNPKTLPPQLEILFKNIKGNLKQSFGTAPPFTVQRLAELILRPSYHYRTLPSYLRALDRIVCVSSTADTFPLPSISTTESEGNGTSLLSSTANRALAEDFNGAALTRIPWLRDTASMMMSSERPLTSDLRTESTSLIDGPNGAGSVETVTVSMNGFPSSSTRDDAQHRQDAPGSDHDEVNSTTDGARSSGQDDAAEEERVRARGPDEIGSADIGPQSARAGHVFDAEAALGRPGEAETVTGSNANPGAQEADLSVVAAGTSPVGEQGLTEHSQKNHEERDLDNSEDGI
jgi:hypothetical protein